MFHHLTVKTRLFSLIGLIGFIMLALTTLNLHGLSQAKKGLKTVYLDRTIPLADIAQIRRMLFENRLSIVNSLMFPNEANEHKELVLRNIKEITKLWDKYMATTLTPEEKLLASKFAESRQYFVTEGLKPAIELIEQNDKEKLVLHISENIRPLFIPVSADIDALLQLQQDVAKQEYEAAENRYQRSLIISIVSICTGLGISFFVSIVIVRQLMAELGSEPSYAASIVNAVAHGNLSVNVNLRAGDKSSLLYSISKMREMLRNVIKSASIVMSDMEKGDLSSRMLVPVQGDFIQLKETINKSLDNVEETLSDIVRVANALAQGNLKQNITKSYDGIFGQTTDSINRTVDELRKLIEEVESIVYSGADCGDFSVKMTMHGKVGYGKRLAELINQLFGTTEKSLNDVLRISQALASGDLTQHIEDDYVGAFASVKVGMNTTVESLKNLIDEIKATSEVIASASWEISEGSNDLSHRTEEQAASLEQTATSMEELTATVQANTDNAKRANELAVDASKTALKGVAVVNDVVSTMMSINESSNRIVDIVSVIDDIAFQTNILALNAAVEAARAGEQGKGFAVVAVEVRNLAQRAANAAGEVKHLIGESVERITGGSKQVAQAGKTMEDIVEAIQEVAMIVAGIASASIEQNAGIDQVHEAVVQMDSVTQQNAVLVEAAAASTESLNQQTHKLATEMAHFKTDAIKQQLDFELF